MKSKTKRANGCELAKSLLEALEARDIELAYGFRDRLLALPYLEELLSLPKAGDSGGKAKARGLVLYALAQVLSRDCGHRTEPDAACQLERLDGILGIRYSVDGQPGVSQPELRNCELLTTAYVSFYWGISALHRRRYPPAREFFIDVLRDAERVGDFDLQANAHFFLATCLRKLHGERERVEHHLGKAIAALKELPHSEGRITVAEIHRAWERFALGDFQHAGDVARRTEQNFGTDFATRAHARALLARIARRQHKYVDALGLIKKAVADFQRRERYHRALARAYANLALTQILLAHEKEQSSERDDLLDDALKQLDSADVIYGHRHYDQQTRPEVDNLRALVEYHKRHFQTAFDMAERTYLEAKLRRDAVEMSTARIIQCMSLIYRRGSGFRSSDEVHAKIADIEKAEPLAQDAVRAIQELGESPNKRRLARAYIWLGKVLLRRPFSDLTRAIECRDFADEFLPKADGGYIREELIDLQREIEVVQRERVSRPEDGAPIVSVSYVDVINRSWKETKEWLANTIISALVASNTDQQIKASIRISPRELGIIKERCKKEKLISQEVIFARKGRPRKKTTG